MNTTYFSFLSALLQRMGDNLADFFAGDRDIIAHFQRYQTVFETYANGFGPLGWTLYGFSLCFLIGILLSLGLLIASLIRRLALKKASAATAAQSEGEHITAPTRFPALSAMDKEWEQNPPAPMASQEGITLHDLCANFRQCCASQWGLFYDLTLIRCFVSSLASTRLLLLEGVSGTGKTSLPCRFAQYLGGRADVIPVEPSWREKSELLGYYNDFNHEYRQTPFLESLYRALNEDGIHFIVLDEINLSRIEYYFAEFLSLLELPEGENRVISLIGSEDPQDPKWVRKGKLPLADNIWFIGTANQDESTFAITDKVYDRAMPLPFSRQGIPFEAESAKPMTITYKQLKELFRETQESFTFSAKAQEDIDRFLDFLERRFGLVVGNRIRDQFLRFLPVYCACGGEEEEALDYLFANKVLRKLGASHLGKEAEISQISTQIDIIFGTESMPLCRQFLHTFGA